MTPAAAYPIPEPRTIAEVEDLLREHGFVTHVCDFGVIVDVPRNMLPGETGDDTPGGSASPCKPVAGGRLS